MFKSKLSSMTKEPKIYNGERTVSSINGGKTGQTYAKEYNWTTILPHTQKSTQHGLNIRLNIRLKP